MILAPSMLAADFANIQSEVEMLNESVADWIHIDVMDGVFVPNISFGLPVVKAIKQHARKPLDVHLMIANPEKYVEEFRKAGAEIISIHAEACNHLHRNVDQIKATGARAGVAINPHTPVSILENVIRDIDLICLMSVNPGYGGQKFIEQTYNKIAQLKELRKQKSSQALIEIDGGVNLDNAQKLMQFGADVLVAGNFVFSSSSPKDTMVQLKSLKG